MDSWIDGLKNDGLMDKKPSIAHAWCPWRGRRILRSLSFLMLLWLCILMITIKFTESALVAGRYIAMRFRSRHIVCSTLINALKKLYGIWDMRYALKMVLLLSGDKSYM